MDSPRGCPHDRPSDLSLQRRIFLPSPLRGEGRVGVCVTLPFPLPSREGEVRTDRDKTCPYTIICTFTPRNDGFALNFSELLVQILKGLSCLITGSHQYSPLHLSPVLTLGGRRFGAWAWHRYPMLKKVLTLTP